LTKAEAPAGRRRFASSTAWWIAAHGGMRSRKASWYAESLSSARTQGSTVSGDRRDTRPSCQSSQRCQRSVP
jgi:hypothetical protein